MLGGMGLAYLFGGVPIVGAAIAAVIAALLIGWISLKTRQREDMLVGAIWSVGMAIGIISIAHTPGYNTDLMSYLLGNLLMVTREQVIAMALLDALMLGLLCAFYRPLMNAARRGVRASARCADDGALPRTDGHNRSGCRRIDSDCRTGAGHGLVHPTCGDRPAVCPFGGAIDARRNPAFRGGDRRRPWCFVRNRLASRGDHRLVRSCLLCGCTALEAEFAAILTCTGLIQ